ncbi:MAG: cell division topological specificity factor MinE [Aquificaceae bacterium]
MTWGLLFNRGKSKEEAKKRLTMVLSYERRGLPPNFADSLREDLISIFSKYPQFEVKRIEVDIRREKEGLEELWISVPFKQ